MKSSIEESRPGCIIYTEMSIAATTPTKKYSRASLEGADRLLKSVKEKLLREKGKIDYAALRRDGYSETLIARLKAIEV